MNIAIHRLVTALFFVSLASANAAVNDKQLLKEAKITRTQAERTALTRVPQGQISASELEREHGKLIWSFDIAKPRTRNISEVQVDAKTGRIVSVKTETPTDQAAEATADKKKH